jgi:transposase-like protein
MEILLEHRYSASWVSRITDVIYEKVEDFRHRKIELGTLGGILSTA